MDTETLRSFDINGEKRYDHTYRTAIIQHLTGIEGKAFIDLGAADGFEGYAAAAHGAREVLCVEGRDELIARGQQATTILGVADRVRFANYDVRRIDTYDLPKYDVVLHFGLLYHLQNPFNHLKRVRNICGGDLLMETQIAPLTLDGAERSQINHLSDLTTVTLDGVPFQGRALEYVTRTGSLGIGSLDRRLVLWLTVESIERALDLAGFDVLLTVHNDPPPELEPWSSLLGHNQQRLKAFFHARVREPERQIDVSKGQIQGLYTAPYSYPTLHGVRRARRWVLHNLMWRWREWLPNSYES
ncbi:MAG: class I SAM-dependent methyltransferase [Anaerolineales bacterium]